MKATPQVLLSASLAFLAGSGVAVAQSPAQPSAAPQVPAGTAAAPKTPQPRKPSPVSEREAERSYVEGAKAVERRDLRVAQRDFAQAVALDPGNADYSTAEQIARSNLVTQLLQESDKARLLGRDDESRARLLEASKLDPENPSVVAHRDSVALPDAGDSPGIQLSGSIVLQPQSGRHSFHLHASGQQLLQQVLTAYGITPSVDDSVKVNRASFDADDVDYAEAARLLRLATDSFFVPLDPKRVLVAKDDKEHRERYERETLETVYLPGLSQEELKGVSDMARTIFDAQQANTQPNGTLTVRAPQARLAALNHTLVGLLDGRGQVDVEVRLVEIDTSHTVNVGVQPPQQFTAFNVESQVQSVINANQSLVQQIVANGLAPAGDLEAIVAVLIASGAISNPILNQPFGVFGNGLTLTGVTVPSVTANLALNSSDTRLIDDAHLRLQDKEAGTVRIGEKYPIETSTYSGITGSSVSIPGVSSAGLSSELAQLGLSGSATQTPIPQVQYQDIGLEFKITPHILPGRDVDLELELKLQALAGAALNNIPELTNRQFNATITARDGQTTAFVSDLTRQESKAVSGIPGLGDLPGFQQTTDDTKQVSKSALLILVTPRVLRREHMEMAGPAILLPRHD